MDNVKGWASPAYARSAHRGLPQERLEDDLCWIVVSTSCLPDDPIGHGSELNRIEYCHQDIDPWFLIGIDWRGSGLFSCFIKCSGCVWLFLACEDYGGRFNESFPAYAFFSFFFFPFKWR